MTKEQSFPQLKAHLTDNDIKDIVAIVGNRCQLKTKNSLRSILTYSPSAVGNYGIMERLTRDEKGRWGYYAGQSYPDEIRTVRNIILGRE